MNVFLVTTGGALVAAYESELEAHAHAEHWK